MFNHFLCQQKKGDITMFRKVLSSSKRQNITLGILYMKPVLWMPVFCILLGILVIAQAKEPKLILSVEEINELIPQIEAAEERPFLNLKVESERWTETKTDLSDPCEQWQRTPIYVSCTAWFGGGPEGKARIDVHKQVLRWRDGAAPYGESSYSVGFDGQQGRVVRYTRGHGGKTFSLKEGELLPDAPELLRGSYLDSCTGAYFTFCFFFNADEYRTFSKLFRASKTPAALEVNAFECALEEFQGIQCIKFGSGEQLWGHETWWLDPSRGLALLGYEKVSTRNGRDRLSSRIEVNELKEVADGVWWPTQVTSVMAPFEPGEPYRRFVYRASKVVANDPNFDESIFTIPFPDGYLIDDKVTGRKYTVGEEPNAPEN